MTIATAVARNPSGAVGFLNVDAQGNLKTAPAGGSGIAQVPAFASSGTVANAAAQANLIALNGKTLYITGFDVSGSGATASSVVAASVGGLNNGNPEYFIGVPADPAAAIPVLQVKFDPPQPCGVAGAFAYAPPFGAGNTHAVVNIYGYYA